MQQVDDVEGYIALRCTMIEFAFREARGNDVGMGGGASLGKRVEARRWIMSPHFEFWSRGLPIDVERARAAIRAEVGDAKWEADDAAFARDRTRRAPMYAKWAAVEAERERIGSLLAEIRMRLVGVPEGRPETETLTLSSVAGG